MHGCLIAIGRPWRIFNRGIVTSRPGNEKVMNILSTSQAKLTKIFQNVASIIWQPIGTALVILVPKLSLIIIKEIISEYY
jgi:hypothetical protein